MAGSELDLRPHGITRRGWDADSGASFVRCGAWLGPWLVPMGPAGPMVVHPGGSDQGGRSRELPPVDKLTSSLLIPALLNNRNADVIVADSRFLPISNADVIIADHSFLQ
ncbi:hypothetical protein F511_06718 [Dorcoceras hygrometricum]|uniref:Uncharacterized protein n=1 Tax=Dorcoceras hygrometricum TaxID=472368 RepID=A0A2Z7AEG0_9LAMI|nr:hypothetical protein F511_06718 [Dorcoceras hygrometricum]